MALGFQGIKMIDHKDLELVLKLKCPPNCERFEMLPPDIKSEPIICFDGNHVRSMRISSKERENCSCVALQYWRTYRLTNTDEVDLAVDQINLWSKFGGYEK